MSEDLSARPDLTGEVRFRVPLVLVIPLTAVAVIGLLAFGFSRVLLSIPQEAATTVAIVSAVNILGACAFLALRPRLARASVFELALVALYPILIGIVIAQTGIATSEEAEPAAETNSQTSGAAASDVIVAQDLAFDADAIDVKAKKPTDFTLDNQDTATHNLVIFPTEEDATDPSTALFTSPDAAAGASEDFTIDPLDKGDYYFHCQYHPTMSGTVSAD